MSLRAVFLVLKETSSDEMSYINFDLSEISCAKGDNGEGCAYCNAQSLANPDFCFSCITGSKVTVDTESFCYTSACINGEFEKYVDGNLECKACATGCKMCVFVELCRVCDTGYDLRWNTCYKTCDPGYYNDSRHSCRLNLPNCDAMYEMTSPERC